jgi:hypothetical protein
MTPENVALASFSRDAKTLIGRARLANFQVKAVRAASGPAVAILGRRHGAKRGLAQFEVIYPEPGASPVGFVIFAGWWRYPLGIRAIIAELDASLSIDGTIADAEA